ncbi:bifunctional riboflavin kinase/FAD synthetase [Peptostreptococcus faecalis]|uniref:bifunctional riboflavin kinase/FAD synthetase n=1 Tax=Peptostreptococcus faecalis TaxID=2045015 RepID=UPI000C7B5F67|nr:bifunctional riboflavin kinase/FAD synthetase [Peptostreptococcus faecalis]
MIVFNSIEEINIPFDTCVTIGNFDGVHIGHQVLIKKAVEYSKKHNLKSVVFTFLNHPVNYFKPGYLKNLITPEEKRKIIEQLGVDVYVCITFDEKMTKINAKEYVEKIIIEKLNSKMMIVGHDFSFAKQKEGNPELLCEYGEKLGFGVEVVTPVLLNGERISSTAIRKYISEGDMVSAQHLLGRYHAVEGVVVKARQIGRTIGFPTANIVPDKDKIIPQKGIYATLAVVDGEVYCGATSIGTNPTVNGKKLSIETYILDFDKTIYGKTLRIEFIEKMRDEIKFESKDELKKQLIKDENYVRTEYVKYLESHIKVDCEYNEKINTIRELHNVKIKNKFEKESV